jgi:anti-anti-sigma factor
MQIDPETVGDVLVLHIQTPQLTSHEAPEMKTKLLGFLIGATKNVLVDLKPVEAMDSTGLGSLLFGLRQAEQHGKDLRFSGVGAKVKFLIHVARLDDVLDAYDGVAEGLEAFRREAAGG